MFLWNVVNIHVYVVKYDKNCTVVKYIIDMIQMFVFTKE